MIFYNMFTSPLHDFVSFYVKKNNFFFLTSIINFDMLFVPSWWSRKANFVSKKMFILLCQYDILGMGLIHLYWFSWNILLESIKDIFSNRIMLIIPIYAWFYFAMTFISYAHMDENNNEHFYNLVYNLIQISDNSFSSWKVNLTLYYQW